MTAAMSAFVGAAVSAAQLPDATSEQTTGVTAITSTLPASFPSPSTTLLKSVLLRHSEVASIATNSAATGISETSSVDDNSTSTSTSFSSILTSLLSTDSTTSTTEIPTTESSTITTTAITSTSTAASTVMTAFWDLFTETTSTTSATSTTTVPTTTTMTVISTSFMPKARALLDTSAATSVAAATTVAQSLSTTTTAMVVNATGSYDPSSWGQVDLEEFILILIICAALIAGVLLGMLGFFFGAFSERRRNRYLLPPSYLSTTGRNGPIEIERPHHRRSLVLAVGGDIQPGNGNGGMNGGPQTPIAGTPVDGGGGGIGPSDVAIMEGYSPMPPSSYELHTFGGHRSSVPYRLPTYFITQGGYYDAV